MKHILTFECEICHNPFESDGRGKPRYCSENCRRVAHAMQFAKYYERKKAGKVEQGEYAYVPDKLDKKLANLKAQGKTYAQMQMEKTLEMARKAVW